jgi:hypothetical protein
MPRKPLEVAFVLIAAGLAVAWLMDHSNEAHSATLRTDVLLGPTAAAQPAAGPQAKQATARPRRVPAYYGQVGLSSKQREMIYSLQAAYAEQIEELERRLEALKSRRDEEIEAVLTPQQRQRLVQLREAAAKRRASQASAAAAKSAPESKQP